MRSGSVVIGFDGTPAAERALRAAGALLAGRPALVVVVWEAGRAFELAENPLGALDTPVATVDVRAAMTADQAMYEDARRLAARGAALAGAAGLNATALVVADEITVADTLIRLARDLDAPALVVGAHSRSRISEVLLGSTSREVVRHAPCPVVVVREEEPG
jgi:nucleotide-binding universal stress UspA family protein